MSPTADPHANALSPLPIALGGLAALGAGMGIGRFLYTPALPVMVADTGLSASLAGGIAAANFAGYLVGALLASLPRLGAHAYTLLIGALLLSAATGAGMALTEDRLIWAGLRFASGMASAFILVFASALVTGHLTRLGRPEWSGIFFGGVGIGILCSALIGSPLIAADGDWQTIWLSGAGVAAIATCVTAFCLPRRPWMPPAVNTAPRVKGTGLWRLVVSYGCLGFGYIVTATFIVQILRESGAGRWEEAFIWAIVGLCAVPAVAFWNHAAGKIGAFRVYQIAMLIEAVGVLASTLGGTAAMIVAAVFLGGTFMGLTALGFQEAARRSPISRHAIIALMTASFSVGQMLGPAVAGWLRDLTGSYNPGSILAAALLIAGAALTLPLQPLRR